MFTHKFEIEMDGVKMEGEIDFGNPNDGIKFTDIPLNTEIHADCLKKIINALQVCKDVEKKEGLKRLIIQEKII